MGESFYGKFAYGEGQYSRSPYFDLSGTISLSVAFTADLIRLQPWDASLSVSVAFSNSDWEVLQGYFGDIFVAMEASATFAEMIRQPIGAVGAEVALLANMAVFPEIAMGGEIGIEIHESGILNAEWHGEGILEFAPEFSGTAYFGTFWTDDLDPVEGEWIDTPKPTGPWTPIPPVQPWN